MAVAWVAAQEVAISGAVDVSLVQLVVLYVHGEVQKEL